MSDTSVINFRAGGTGSPPDDGDVVRAMPDATIMPDVVADVDGGLAARMRAKRAQLENRTREFRVPPEDVWNGELILVAKPIRLIDNESFVAFVSRATSELRILDPDTGSMETIPGGWSGVGELMGIPGDVTVGDIILAVCSTREIIGDLVEQILAFIRGRTAATEQALGE